MSKLRIRIEPTDPQSSQAMSLLREAALEARRLYRRIDVGVPLRQFIDSNAPIPTNAPLPPRGAYFIAFLGSHLVGSGALRPLDETTVEVRRMYVIRSARRAGVGGALLAHLERTAADLDFRVTRLETGNRQLPAMALYESCGFVRIPPFGDYVSDPTSVCYEKRICTG